MTTPSRTTTASDLMKLAREKPPEVVIAGFAYVGDVALLHGPEESFKSVFVLQLAESLAAGTPLFDLWEVPSPRRVGIIETEIHPVMLGQRLIGMFPSGEVPESLVFMSEEGVKDVRRAGDIKKKLQVVGGWVKDAGVQVLIIDTANDFFRGDDNLSAVI
jgi:RecA-family ATPase